ncbi:MAG TPA: phosphoribosylformylglycinamidine cyclo-ligase [Verrucomicrobiota bacterium]|nr:phosphoribosylformylglycinamidine cyclo-ligase [Verrucomicrobiota bacterium]HNU49572.1 phosphoribosylformylglycinamidine cyclo-ligase [Verrucomicrobiota bacterium]
MASVRKPGRAYAAAGVDIELGNTVKATLPALLARTRRPGVIGTVGGFGGLFALDPRRYRQPVLVASVDGVGTKLKVAFAMDRHDTIGQDLVNHCVNDIAVLGAEPLFFLDYLGTGRLEPRVFEAILRGFAKACAENRCALIGGETAQMPGFYGAGEYDVAGTIVGVVDRGALRDGPRTIRAGDMLVGVASNGLHTNGYSLARRILFEQMGLKPRDRVPELGGRVGDELLKVHVSYGPVIRALLRRFEGSGQTPVPPSRRVLKAFAHITGGGFTDNLPRVLPARCDALIRRGTWEVPPVFRLLAERGGVAEVELYQVFNMGIGLVAVVAPGCAEAVRRRIAASGHRAWLIGEIVPGTGVTRIV